MAKDPINALHFDASAGKVIREPPGAGYGNWVGGKVYHDDVSGQFALFYRSRRPLEQGRAGRCAVALSDDGVNFTDVWSASKEDLDANSVEEGHCVRDGEEWKLYLSYEVAGTSKWRIDVIRASTPERFEAQSRRTVLNPGDYGLAWIKDPFLMRNGSGWWLYAAAPPRSGPRVDGARIEAGALDSTVLARSQDGLYFPSIEYVFEAPADDSWHGRRARINSLIPWDGGYLAFFDGGRTFYDNYEEMAGLAESADGVEFTRLDTGGPWLSSPHGIVRYVCAVPVADEVFFYYEYTRADGSHELRVNSLTV